VSSQAKCATIDRHHREWRMGINTRRCEAGIAALRCYRISNDRARVTRERPRRVRRLARHIRDGGPFFAPPARTPAHPAMKRCRRRHCSRVPSTLLSVRRPGAQSPPCYPSRPRTQPASASAAGLSLPPSRTQAAPGSRAPGMELRRGGSPLCDAVAARELARMLFVRPRRFLSVSHADLAGLT
jgi:hypothetical protein